MAKPDDSIETTYHGVRIVVTETRLQVGDERFMATRSEIVRASKVLFEAIKYCQSQSRCSRILTQLWRFLVDP